MILFGIAFLAGLVTILTPCIWPLLPVVLSTSFTAKGKRGPLGLSVGIVCSFSLLTLFLSSIIRILYINPNGLRIGAVIVIILFGLVLLVPFLMEKYESLIARVGAKSEFQSKGKGFFAGFIQGIVLGVIWTPCAGPVLATVVGLSTIGSISFNLVGLLIFYTLGTAFPIFLLAYASRTIFTKVTSISRHIVRIQQIFGAMMIIVAILIATNLDQVIQSDILQAMPFLNTAVNGFESSQTITKALNTLKGKSSAASSSQNLLNTNYPAPAITGITDWLNTKNPVSLNALKGHVVLVDFWTYSCINCIRELPHVVSWYQAYMKYGFTVIGIHTPEFAFEQDKNNVLKALSRNNITFPVGLDNNYATWNSFSNQYWPAQYLIDANGNVRRTDFGEGSYDQMQQAIVSLLEQNGSKVTAHVTSVADKTPKGLISPETYLGSARMQYFYPDGSITPTQTTFTSTSPIPENSFSLGGAWAVQNDYIQSIDPSATLTEHFVAGNVYIIIKPPSKGSAIVHVLLDGQVIPSNMSGSDVVQGQIQVDEVRLYHIVDLHGSTEDHTVTLIFDTPQTQAYTFTFG